MVLLNVKEICLCVCLTQGNNGQIWKGGSEIHRQDVGDIFSSSWSAAKLLEGGIWRSHVEHTTDFLPTMSTTQTSPRARCTL